MISRGMVRRSRRFLIAVAALATVPAIAREGDARQETAPAPSLEEQFRDPPASARPRVWWHWMNGNVTKEGIAKDLAWMKRVGIGGLQNFDANQTTPQIVDKRLAYMTPEWKDAFRFAAAEAERLGLELAIASSPGWSETGGPWVAPADALKKLVWSETIVRGGRRLSLRLAAPPKTPGSYGRQSNANAATTETSPHVAGSAVYGDIAVFAYPIAGFAPLPPARFIFSDGTAIDAAALADDDPETAIPLPQAGTEPPSVVVEYPSAQTIRSLTLHLPGGGPTVVSAGLQPRLEASDDGKAWRSVAEIALSGVPSTVAFAPVTARFFRLTLAPARGTGSQAGLQLPPGLDLAALANAGLGGGAGPRLATLQLSAEPRVNQFESKAGFATAPDYYRLDTVADPAMRAPGLSEVIDLTARLKPDGTLDWRAPRGNWRVVRLGWSLTGKTNHPATAEATGLEVDKMDAAAVRRYLDRYLAMYRDAAGADLVGERGVRAILTDSTEVGSFNWTPAMIAQFKRLRGYDPTPWLPVLTGAIIGSPRQSDAFLYDYRRTIGDLHATEHYGTLAAFAHEHGLKVYGEALENGRPSLGDDMRMRSFADYPMGAMWYAPGGTTPVGSFLADIKGASSVAHVYGQNIAAAESLTSALAPWGTGPSDLKPTIDVEFVNGINRPVIANSVHSPEDDKVPGLSLGIFGQYFNRHEAWGEMAKPWIDYIARNSLLLQQGRNLADVAYFYGEEAPLTSLYAGGPPQDAPKTSAYDFVNTDALTRLLANDGSDIVVPSGARYRLLYLGGNSRRLTVPTLRKIAALAEGGATILGNPPEASPSLADDPAEFQALVQRLWSGGGETAVGRGRMIAGTDVEAALRRIGVTPDFRYEGGRTDSRIDFLHRRLSDGDNYFLVSRVNRAEAITAHFRVTGKVPQLWHADTGRIEPVSYRIENGETIVPLVLDPFGSVHVVFRRDAVAPALEIRRPPPILLGTVESPWQVSFQPDRGAPADTRMTELAPLQAHADPGIRYFSGVATYTTMVAAPGGWKPGRPLWLDLGAVHDLAEVSVNGKPMGALWHAPFRIDIGSAMRAGKNRLEIKVANLWANRLIGDAQPGAKKIAWTSIPTYLPTAELRPSGLVGPVQLWGEGP